MAKEKGAPGRKELERSPVVLAAVALLLLMNPAEATVVVFSLMCWCMTTGERMARALFALLFCEEEDEDVVVGAAGATGCDGVFAAEV